MAKAETGLIAVRVPVDLLERVDAAGARTDIVLAALRAHFDPAGPVVDDARLAALENEIAAVRRLLDQMATERDKWRTLAQAVTSGKPGKPVVPAAADPSSSKMVAQVLPVTGTQFPKQLTHWQKQAAESARQKPGKAGR